MTYGILLQQGAHAVEASFSKAPRRIGGVDVVSVGAEEARRILVDRIEARLFTKAAFLNAHCVNVAHEQPAYRACLEDFDVFPDGIGIDLAARLLYGRAFPENLNGTDFVPYLLRETMRPLTVALVGAAPGVAERAALSFAAEGPQHRFHVVSHGFFRDGTETEAVIEALRALRPDVVLVALGVPRQELFIARHLSAAECTLAVGVGALFDFMAGEVSRAPPLLRVLRLEWIYRLAIEPRRLWKRYLLGNPIFFGHILAERVRGPASRP